MRGVPEEERDALEQLAAALAQLAAERQHGAPLLFGPSGAPSEPTLALALAWSCRGPADVARLLTPVREARERERFDAPAAEDWLVARLVEAGSEDPAQTALALRALRAAARALLAQAPPLPSGEAGSEGFDAAALTFCHTRREMLQRVADRCGVAAGTGDSRLDVDSIRADTVSN
jgi:hypothetical protein